MIDVDLVTKPGSNQPFQGESYWGIATIVVIVCTVASLGLLGWYVMKNSSTKQKIANQTTESARLDGEILAANKWPVDTVELRSKDLLGSLTEYKTLLNSRQAWSRILPVVSASTLNGINLTGMSIDGKLALKIDGTASPISGVDNITAYGMVARQVISYQNAKITISDTSGATSTTEVAPVLVFSNVALTAISKNSKAATQDATPIDSALFSISLSLNPEIVKESPLALPSTTTTASPSPSASATP
ncbi:MAG: hypothetical protein WC773_00530 [Patescibacteria group bacterium]|jgi:hypothetical protein